MITIVNPGFFTIAVDAGRTGYGAIGIPSSAALDFYAYQALQYLINSSNVPVLEVIGRKLTLKFGIDLICALTGAKVQAFVDERPIDPWTSFSVRKGNVLRIRDVTEGFRYYLGFTGLMDVENVMGSGSTNVECRFGGFAGRPLKAGDQIRFRDTWEGPIKTLTGEAMPSVAAPHEIRVIEGPETDFFESASLDKFWSNEGQIRYIVSSASNRAGIRLEGEKLAFRESRESSIISEGILPGTIQISGDGMPLIALNERTIGGYARIGTVSRGDRDRLAHLAPGDTVTFIKISRDQARSMWREKCRSRRFS